MSSSFGTFRVSLRRIPRGRRRCGGRRLPANFELMRPTFQVQLDRAPAGQSDLTPAPGNGQVTILSGVESGRTLARDRPAGAQPGQRPDDYASECGAATVTRRLYLPGQ